MKTRLGFVSNSSSSSFIVIASSDVMDKSNSHLGKDFVIDSTLGECEFGWQIDSYVDMYTKINWAWIIATNSPDKLVSTVRLETLFSVIKKYTGAKNVIVKLSTDCRCDNRAYIDHQSAERETPENAAMFSSEQELTTFLFSMKSYIQNDNDNH